MSTPEKVTFPSRAYKLAGLFYPPVAGSPDRAGASIAGFTCLTYDAAYQGESEGEPRDLEDPYQRVEDIKCAVTYLVGRKEVDSNKIGVLGICASGGYAPFAAQTDLRIKAVATSAAVCVGTMARRGFDKDSSNREILKTQLEAAGKDRNSDLGGEKIPAVHMLPEKPEDAPAEMPESFRDLMSYYRTPRAFHPRATNTTLARGWDIMANFDAFAHNYLISPRPCL
ncbi:X-pro dipeptidyl-peptidase (S15 family) protein [Penicillium chermesinum]|nr:X-pro dipeptidyl-peptidase (S15 family) protein [Penicillium chermesinum]